MRRTAIALVVLLLAASCGDDGGPSLVGVWTGTEVGGETGQWTLVIDETDASFASAGTEFYEAAYVAFPDENPKRMEFVIASSAFPEYVGETARSIYRFDGETLIIASKRARCRRHAHRIRARRRHPGLGTHQAVTISHLGRVGDRSIRHRYDRRSTIVVPERVFLTAGPAMRPPDNARSQSQQRVRPRCASSARVRCHVIKLPRPSVRDPQACRSRCLTRSFRRSRPRCCLGSR